jgi:hypothetical protein
LITLVVSAIAFSLIWTSSGALAVIGAMATCSAVIVSARICQAMLSARMRAPARPGNV